LRSERRIELPDFARAFEYENAFYLSSHPSRLAKAMAHYDLFRRTLDISGEIVECGVFKGTSLIRLATFWELFASPFSKRIIAFDTFASFPPTGHAEDRPFLEHMVNAAGSESIGRDQLLEVLQRKGLDRNIELVAGDILQTVPAYVSCHPELRISLLNLDTDTYEPARVILEHLWDRIVPGGILLLDDFATFPGETRAVEKFFGERPPPEVSPLALQPHPDLCRKGASRDAELGSPSS
jgi:hypothetical protein